MSLDSDIYKFSNTITVFDTFLHEYTMICIIETQQDNINTKCMTTRVESYKLNKLQQHIDDNGKWK